MSTDDTKTPLRDDEPSAGLEADAAADAAADASAAVANDADATAEPHAGAQDTPRGDPPDAAASTREIAPWSPGSTTDLEAAAHRIIDGPDAEPPRSGRRAAAPVLPAPRAPWRGPPPAPPSEQLRPSAPHTNADTPSHAYASPSVQTGPTGGRIVAETPAGPRNRARHNRIAGLAQTSSHAQGETPAAGDSRAMEQRMHPKGDSRALGVRMQRVMAERKARLADPDIPRRRRRERPPGPLDGDRPQHAMRQRIAEAKK